MSTPPRAAFCLLLTACGLTGASLAETGQAPTSSAVERATVSVARAVDGTIIACPDGLHSFTPDRQCVRAPSGPEAVKVRLNHTLTDRLLTAWRAQDNAVYAYNYLRQGQAYVSVIVGPAAAGASLLVLDVARTKAQTKQPQPDRQTNARTKATGPDAATSGKTGPHAKNSAPSAPGFRRPLALGTPRLFGEDVRAAQNRLVEVAGLARGAGGDGYFGPVTAATVKAFQQANALPVTGVLDRTTWARLFSPAAKAFTAQAVDVFLGRPGAAH